MPFITTNESIFHESNQAAIKASQQQYEDVYEEPLTDVTYDDESDGEVEWTTSYASEPVEATDYENYEDIPDATSHPVMTGPSMLDGSAMEGLTKQDIIDAVKEIVKGGGAAAGAVSVEKAARKKSHVMKLGKKAVKPFVKLAWHSPYGKGAAAVAGLSMIGGLVAMCGVETTRVKPEISQKDSGTAVKLVDVHPIVLDCRDAKTSVFETKVTAPLEIHWKAPLNLAHWDAKIPRGALKTDLTGATGTLVCFDGKGMQSKGNHVTIDARYIREETSFIESSTTSVNSAEAIAAVLQGEASTIAGITAHYIDIENSFAKVYGGLDRYARVQTVNAINTKCAAQDWEMDKATVTKAVEIGAKEQGKTLTDKDVTFINQPAFKPQYPHFKDGNIDGSQVMLQNVTCTANKNAIHFDNTDTSVKLYNPPATSSKK